ncbi:hypothetical protein V8G54_001973, partial [Vigna mungo]
SSPLMASQMAISSACIPFSSPNSLPSSKPYPLSRTLARALACGSRSSPSQSHLRQPFLPPKLAHLFLSLFLSPLKPSLPERSVFHSYKELYDMLLCFGSYYGAGLCRMYILSNLLQHRANTPGWLDVKSNNCCTSCSLRWSYRSSCTVNPEYYILLLSFVAFLTLFVDYQTLRTVKFAMIENKTNDNQFRPLLSKIQIDAHVGGVNDLAFSHPNKQLCVITCVIQLKVWDAASGSKQYTFEGHEAPVYSVCPHYKENIQFIFSTTLDGKIKAWLYDNLGSRVDYDNLESFGGYGGPMRSYGRMYDSLYFDDVSIYI